jgi:hypothetical protein
MYEDRRGKREVRKIRDERDGEEGRVEQRAESREQR